VKSEQRPYEPDWQTAQAFARAAAGCRVRCRRSKLPCRTLAEAVHRRSRRAVSEKLPSSNRVEPSLRQDACDDEEHQYSALRNHKGWLGSAGCGHSGGEATFHLVPPVQDQSINKCPALRHRSSQMRHRPVRNGPEREAHFRTALPSVDRHAPSSTWTAPVAYQRLRISGRLAFRAASVPASSACIRRPKPTASAANIAARRRSVTSSGAVCIIRLVES